MVSQFHRCPAVGLGSLQSLCLGRRGGIRLIIVAAWFGCVGVAVGDDIVTAVGNEFESPAAARRIEKSLGAAVQRVAPAVVALDTAENLAPLGSGILIDPTGVVLTHGHSDSKVGDTVRVRFPDGRAVKGYFQSVHSGSGRDFSVVRISEQGTYPFVPLKTSESPATGSHCFYLGYPNVFNRDTLGAPLLRFGRISGTGRLSVYANCLIMSGDSGGPLFDMDGRLLGVLNYSIGPQLRHPGQWAAVGALLESRTWFQPTNPNEAVELGFTKRDRTGPDTTRRVAHAAFQALVKPAANATVQILVDGEPAILGTIVAPNGIVLTKRSEVLNSAGQPIGKLTCRTFAPESLIETVTVHAQFPLDDVVFLKIAGGKLASPPAEIHRYEVPRGTLVTVPIHGQAASEIGVIGTERPLKIERNPGILPLALEESPAGVRVEKVLRPGANKAAATVQIGDVITHLNGQATPTLEACNSMMANETITAGDPLVLSLRRDNQALTCIVHADSESLASRIHQYQYAHVSLRRTGFPSVLSHDAMVARANCGGPVVDLQGRIVGINIARIQRCSTLTLPANRILELLAQMHEAGMK
jgi:serine protease Do